MREDLPTGTVTFLFTDVEGSTKLLKSLGAEAYADALAEHRRIVRDACASHDGVEVDTQGDGFFFAFARARDAVLAAYDPVSVVADADGNLYVSDHHNDLVRRIDKSGTITAFAGTGVRGFSGDGAPASSARLNQPWALTVCDGTLYITDSFNHRVRTVRLSA